MSSSSVGGVVGTDVVGLVWLRVGGLVGAFVGGAESGESSS